MKRNGNAERRRRGNRGAEGGGRGAAGARIEAPRGWSVGRGVPLPTGGEAWGGGCAPSPEFFFILALNMVSLGAFWMVFFTAQLPVLRAKPEFNCYRRIKAVMMSR